ncbi:LPXTG cell wall anchor domain-containing protein [Lactobacillus sp. PSON]|uniref:LPXTG cell wall anchor domain-containing protein n=1 Tax=Lactobacillus sp. PSON TaxID=3455454 RepID=UPI0040420F26
MKINRVYQGAIVGITSTMIGSFFFTNNVLADEIDTAPKLSNEDHAVTESSNASKVDKVIVESNKLQDSEQDNNSISSDQMTSNKKDEDVVWEPAPPLTKAQDNDYDETSGNQSSNGVVRPHAQKTSKAKKSTQKSAKKVNSQISNSERLSSYSNNTISKKFNNKEFSSAQTSQHAQKATIRTNETEYKMLPAAGENNNKSIIVGTTMLLSSVGLLGIKKRKN